MVDQAPKGFRIKLPLPQDSPEPRAANFFYFTFAGADVQMLIGYVDLRAIHDLKETAEPTLAPEILHRLSIGQLGFKQLRAQVDEIAKKYDEIQGDPTANA